MSGSGRGTSGSKATQQSSSELTENTDEEAPIPMGDTDTDFSYESIKESGWTRPSSMSRGESR